MEERRAGTFRGSSTNKLKLSLNVKTNRDNKQESVMKKPASLEKNRINTPPVSGADKATPAIPATPPVASAAAAPGLSKTAPEKKTQPATAKPPVASPAAAPGLSKST